MLHWSLDKNAGQFWWPAEFDNVANSYSDHLNHLQNPGHLPLTGASIVLALRGFESIFYGRMRCAQLWVAQIISKNRCGQLDRETYSRVYKLYWANGTHRGPTYLSVGINNFTVIIYVWHFFSSLDCIICDSLILWVRSTQNHKTMKSIHEITNTLFYFDFVFYSCMLIYIIPCEGNISVAKNFWYSR